MLRIQAEHGGTNMRSTGWIHSSILFAFLVLTMCFTICTASYAGPPAAPHSVFVAGDHVQHCSCDGASSSYSASGGCVEGWQVTAGGCTTYGATCPTSTYGSAVYSANFTVPSGKCVTGMDFYIVDMGTAVPTCSYTPTLTCAGITVPYNTTATPYYDPMTDCP